MANLGGISAGQQVLGSDGGMIGVVEGVEGDVLAVRSTGDRGGGHHHVPSDWIERVDTHVQLNRKASVAWETWETHRGAGRGGAATSTVAGAATPHRTEARKGSLLPWIVLGILVLVALIALFRGFAYQDDPSTAEPSRSTESDTAR